MNELCACTIVSKNYLSQARVLVDSFLEHHPGATVYVLLVDTVSDYFDPNDERFKLIPIADLNIPQGESFYFKYTILELNTAAKPFFLQHLFSKLGWKKIIYFDPDILITRPLNEVTSFLDEYSMILTPHITSPINDSLKPDERTFLLSGSYNLGFIGLKHSATTERFLSWWADRVYDQCLHKIDEGLFVDQKWIDLVPGMFPNVHILRDSAYNVAYWNLHERKVTSTNGKFYVNGKPMCFYHFSGFIPESPWLVSKYQTRFVLRDLPVLAELFEQYRSLLYRAGYKEIKQFPYAFGTFDNGEPITDHMRRLYAEMYKKKSFGNPFLVKDGKSNFYMWFRKQGKNRRLVRIIANYILHAPFVHSIKFGIKRLLGPLWFYRIKRFLLKNNLGGKTSLYKDTLFIQKEKYEASIETLGINVAGYINAESGVGEAVRSTIKAIEKAKLPFVTNNFNLSVARQQDTTYQSFTNVNPFPINCIHVNADQVDIFVQKYGTDYFEKKYNIGYWLWELSVFPEHFKNSFRYFDEIWTSSFFSQDAIAALSPVPVKRMPLVVEVQQVSRYDRSHFDIPRDAYIFLFTFDFLSVFERKNPLDAVNAFRKAFSRHDKAMLVIKCINKEKFPRYFEELCKAVHSLSVKIIDTYMSRDELTSLFATTDAYVSLHRSEGFGYTIAESMSCGKPVIATAYSGNTDFMNINNSFPVRYRLIHVPKAVGPYQKGNVWADPDTDHAAEIMRFLYKNPNLGVAIGKKAALDIARELGPTAVSAAIKKRLETIITQKKIVA